MTRDSFNIRSDGEIYCQIRYYEKNMQYDLLHESMMMLSPPKQEHLVWLLERVGYTQQLDKLADFPGLITQLELGSIRRDFALNLDKFCQNYLGQHTFNCWNTITLEDNSLYCSIDQTTAQLLQGLAPGISISDRRYIEELSNSGVIFPSIRDTETRQRMRDAILGLDIIIPTIKTWHENCKLLEIGVHVIRRELVNWRGEPLFDIMHGIWTPPSECFLEIDEGLFCVVQPPSDDEHLCLAIIQIFLSIWRQFPNLGNIPPLRDIRNIPLQAQINPTYQVLLARRARLFGFNSHQIQQNSILRQGQLTLTTYKSVSPRRAKTGTKTRWGRPYGHTFTQLQKSLFIPNMSRARFETSREPSVLFVQQDLLKAFFGPLIFADWVVQSSPCVNLITNEDYRLAGMPTLLTGYDHRFITEVTVADPVPSLEASVSYSRSSSTTHQSISTPIGPLRDILDTESRVSSTVSRSSQNFSSPSVIRTVLSSPRVQNLTEQFMNTDIEAGSSIYSPQLLWESGSNITVPENNIGDRSHRSYLDISGSNSGITTEDQSHLNLDRYSPDTSSSSLVIGDRSHRSYLDISSNSAITTEDQSHLCLDEYGPSSYVNSDTSSSGLIIGDRSISESNSAIMEDQSRLDRYGPSSYVSSATSSSSLIGDRSHRSYLDIPESNLGITTEDQSYLYSDISRPNSYVSSDTSSSSLIIGDRFHRSYLDMLGSNSGATQDQSHISHSSGIPEQRIRDNNHKSLLKTRRRRLKKRDGYLRILNPLKRRNGRLGRERAQSSSLGLTHSEQSEGNMARRESEGSIPQDFAESTTIFEHNGMRLVQKSITNLEEHLNQRKGWVGMIIVDNEVKSLRLNHIAKYIKSGDSNRSQTVILVKNTYAERFREKYSNEMLSRHIS